MHSPRIPLDFDWQGEGYGKWHIASGDTGVFWFGFVLFFGMSWNLWRALRSERGFYSVRMWPLSPVSPEHPMGFWLAIVMHSSLLLAGLDMMVSGLIGIRPFSLGN